MSSGRVLFNSAMSAKKILKLGVLMTDRTPTLTERAQRIIKGLSLPGRTQFTEEQLRDYGEYVRLEEREECAKLVEGLTRNRGNVFTPAAKHNQAGWNNACTVLARFIRGRGES